MFKNNIFNINVDAIEWGRGAMIRAIKTMAQTAAAMLTVSVGTAGINEIAWVNILSISAVAGVYSLVTSVAGIPEAPATTYKADAENAVQGITEAYSSTQGKAVDLDEQEHVQGFKAENNDAEQFDDLHG
ncbi:MAG: holin [Clostridia bacterium]|nr:holin [Clostridia bacterium]